MKKSTEIILVDNLAQALHLIILDISRVKPRFSSSHFFRILEARGLDARTYKKCMQILESQYKIKIKENEIYVL